MLEGPAGRVEDAEEGVVDDDVAAELEVGAGGQKALWLPVPFALPRDEAEGNLLLFVLAGLNEEEVDFALGAVLGGALLP